jgi:DNA-binding SARP family transcriptional activator
VQFRILGPLEVTDADATVPLGGPRQRALLASLLLRPNEVVPRDRLIDDVWGDDPPGSARKIVQLYVSALRKAFDPERRILLTQAPGYRLAVEPEQLDAVRFERLVAEARRRAPAERAALLREALSLWRGPALADLVGEPFAQAEIARLEELRLAALEDRIAAELECGRVSELVPELEALVTANPLRERLRARLMLALYRSGRQADALEAYRHARQALVDELGIEPGAELREVERAILAQDPALAAPSAVEETVAARKPVTAVFVELAPVEDLDAERLAPLIDAAANQAAAVLERHGASVERTAGSLVGLFGAARVHEDDPIRAARAALEIPDAVAAPLVAAVTVNSGDVVADAAASTLRPARTAQPGEVVIGEAAARLLRSAAVARRSDAPLVGRADELAQLERAFERVVRTRRPALVTIVGPAGIGKSRLTAELARRLAADVVGGRCLAYGEGITFWPLTELLKRRFGDEPRAGIEEALAGDSDAAAIADRLEVAGADGTEEIAWAARRLLEALARRRPLLVVLDDVQWAESAFLDLVERVAALARDAPLLLLCLARPELLDERPDWGGARLNAATIVLEPLSEDESGLLIGHLAGEVDDDERARIAGAAEGNPLFIEQVIAMRGEAGGGRDLPSTIHALLAARLDALPRAERALLQRASVAGKEFWSGFSGGGPVLDALVAKDLVARAASMLPGEPGFRFRHQLIRDAAYRSLPKRARAEQHAAFAEWLEARAGEAKYVEIAGWHLAQAAQYRGELGEPDEELARAAARRLAVAGRRAYDRTDIAAARSLLGRAAGLLAAEDPERTAVLPLFGDALRASGDFDAARSVLDEAIERGDERTAWNARLGLLRTRLRTHAGASTDELRAECDAAIAALDALGDAAGLADAWSVRAWVDWLDGRAAATAAAAQLALETARHAGARTIERRAEQILLQTLVYGPTPVGEAAALCERLLEREDAPITVATASRALAGLRAMAGDFEEARRLRDRDLAILTELGFELMTVYAEELYGTVELLAGDTVAAEERFRRGYDATKGEIGGATFAALLAEAARRSGRLDEALALTEEAARAAPDEDLTTNVQWRATRARALTDAGRAAEAHVLAREAVELAERTDFLSLQADAVAALPEPGARARARVLYARKGNLSAAAAL